MKNGTIAALALMLVLGGAVGIAKAAHHEEKRDLETIMEKFHKGRTSVAARAGKGEATKEEIKKGTEGEKPWIWQHANAARVEYDYHAREEAPVAPTIETPTPTTPTPTPAGRGASCGRSGSPRARSPGTPQSTIWPAATIWTGWPTASGGGPLSPTDGGPSSTARS